MFVQIPLWNALDKFKQAESPNNRAEINIFSGLLRVPDYKPQQPSLRRKQKCIQIQTTTD